MSRIARTAQRWCGHASYDGFDCHAADALKELFDDSVFTLDAFSQAP